jgi:hypothetical protein
VFWIAFLFADSGLAAMPATGRVAWQGLPLAFEVIGDQRSQPTRGLVRGPGFSASLSPVEVSLGASRRPGDALRLHLIGADPEAPIHGLEPLPGVSNYFVGKDSKHWEIGVPTYRKAQFDHVYPGIDVAYHGDQTRLEYDFVIAPHADPKRIELDFVGRRLRLNEVGDLLSYDGRVIQRHPVAYQEFAGERRAVEVRYVLHGPRRVALALGNYDRSRTLVVDPTFLYSTYLGGSADDGSVKLAVDSGGAVYITGYTNSADFPTTAGMQPTYAGGGDAFVAKLDPTGATLIYSTYLGGSGSDAALSIAIDGNGNAYVAGNTNSVDFPTTANAAQPALAGSTDAFVTVLDSTGALAYSTYLGGSGLDVATAIAVDGNGNAFVTGYTQSTDFPTTSGAVQKASAGGDDAFVTQFSSAGSVVYSTYLGGRALDIARGIAVDAAGNAYLAGYTQSPDFPTTNGALQTVFGGGNADAFVALLDPTGATLSYSTYLGGNADDYAFGIAIDGSGNAYVVGNSNSSNFPVTAGAVQSGNAGGVDAFAVTLDAAGATLSYGTYLGGSAYDTALSVAVDASGSAFITGYTQSANFPTTSGAMQPAFAGGTSDAFLVQLTAVGALGYGSYLGGSGSDAGYGVAVASSGTVYVGGNTTSSNFPTTSGVVQPAAGGGNDAFVAAVPVDAFDEIFADGFE